MIYMINNTKNDTIQYKEDFTKWFANSKVVNDNGKPLKLFHGTNAKENFTKFKLSNYDLGIHFGTIEHANNRLKKLKDNEYSRIIPVCLKIENPLEISDVFTGVPWSFFQKIGNNDGEGILTEEEENFILDKYGESFEEGDYYYTYNDYEFYQDITRMLISKGYDGIKYLNDCEVDERVINNYDYSWVVFSNDQIKNFFEVIK